MVKADHPHDVQAQEHIQEVVHSHDRRVYEDFTDHRDILPGRVIDNTHAVELPSSRDRGHESVVANSNSAVEDRANRDTSSCIIEPGPESHVTDTSTVFESSTSVVRQRHTCGMGRMGFDDVEVAAGSCMGAVGPPVNSAADLQKESKQHCEGSTQNESAGLSRRDSATCTSSDDSAHNHFSPHYIFVDGVNPETVVLGTALYARFQLEEINRQHLDEPGCMNPNSVPSMLTRNTSVNINAQEVTHMAAMIRQIADAFAQSPHRQEVRERAASVDLSSLDFNSFSDLLFGLFQEGGVRYERVVVLFFFCSDMVIRALQESFGARFHELINWTQQYIMINLSVWIQENGGWGAVLQHSMNSVYKMSVILLCSVSVIACIVYIRRNC